MSRRVGDEEFPAWLDWRSSDSLSPLNQVNLDFLNEAVYCCLYNRSVLEAA